MAKPVVFIIGATGNIGSATVTELASKHGGKLDIRAGVRNPESEKADKLKGLAGVTVVQAEMGDNDKLVETLKGVDTLYINTPAIKNRVEVTVATANSAKKAGVKHLVVVSVASDNNDGFLFGRQFTKIENTIKELGLPYTFLRLPSFMENNFGQTATIKGQSSIFSPVDPTKPYVVVAVEDAGKFGAVVVADPRKHFNKVYNVISDRYTYNDLAAAFSEVLGREIKYVRVPYEASKQAFQTNLKLANWQVEGLMELFKLIDEGATTMKDHDLSSFTDITGDKPTDIKTWVTKNAAAYQ